jgi:DNA (cytosine-5)-methyltransferase 1
MVRARGDKVSNAFSSSIHDVRLGSIDVELFAGGGGMAVGLREAGFVPVNWYETDEVCCETLARNSVGKSATLSGKVTRSNVEDLDWLPLRRKVRLLAAGVPCQPFSLGGKHHSHRDDRNLFPEVLRAVHETRPTAVLLENVRGIVRESFRSYFDYLLLQMRFPSIALRKKEKWRDHKNRLKQEELREAPEYNVSFKIVNSADFGVPQNRLRVFIVATRADFPAYIFPSQTHSRESLELVLSGTRYWERHGIKRPSNYPRSELHLETKTSLLPWVTVRDALAGLPVPTTNEIDAEINHWAIPGARPYEGHTGSQMDWPAKTIKAGVHGVPGGENAITDDLGTFRYLTLREMARIQSFPDNHLFCGRRLRVTRQIGNAVPCRLAKAIAAPLHKLVCNAVEVQTLRILNGSSVRELRIVSALGDKQYAQGMRG